jgi:hypothetical protein
VHEAVVAVGADQAGSDGGYADARWATVASLLQRLEVELDVLVLQQLPGGLGGELPADHTVLIEVFSALMDDRRLRVRSLLPMAPNPLLKELEAATNEAGLQDALAELAVAARRAHVDTDQGRDFGRRPLVLVWAALMSAATRLGARDVAIKLAAAAAACISAAEVVHCAMLFGALASLLRLAGVVPTCPRLDRTPAVGTEPQNEAACPWFAHLREVPEVQDDLRRFEAAQAPGPTPNVMAAVPMQRIIMAAHTYRASVAHQVSNRAACAYSDAEVWF